jgi:ubiquinone/menaquinone biosynthesis C-methylase UbiE
MTKHHRTPIVASLAAAAVLAAAGWLYHRRPRQRIPGQEGLDDPDVARAFARVASWPQMRLLRWLVARRAAEMVRQGEAVDLGCGPGYLAVEMAHRSPGLRVTGVDLSDEMLAQAEAYAQQAGVAGRVSFRKGDAGQIPFPDGSLDLVVSTLSLHHWNDPPAVLNEVGRILRPGGSFLIVDLRRDLPAPSWLLLWFATHVVVPRALRRANEPLGSRDAGYTPPEAALLAQGSRLTGWRVTHGPLWLTIEGSTKPAQAGGGRAEQ